MHFCSRTAEAGSVELNRHYFDPSIWWRSFITPLIIWLLLTWPYYSILRCAFGRRWQRTNSNIHLESVIFTNFGYVYNFEFRVRLLSILSNVRRVVSFLTQNLFDCESFFFTSLASIVVAGFGRMQNGFSMLLPLQRWRNSYKFVIKFICWLVIKCNQTKVNEAK